ncbi:MAG: hypothetical protein ABIO70_12030 [Pseudomonadota bacterium]
MKSTFHAMLALALALGAASLPGCAAQRMARFAASDDPFGRPRAPDDTSPPWSKQGGLRKDFLWTQELPASPEIVFPLLCPVEEYRWLPAWRCEMVHSASGVAEEGCVFTTRLATGETWLGTRYEPPNAVAYAVFSRHLLMVQQASLAELEGGGSTIRWSRSYTALDRIGRLYLEHYDQAKFEREMGFLLGKLGDHLCSAPGACSPWNVNRATN